MTCPNINLDSWKQLVEDKGEALAYYLWFKYNGEVSQFLVDGEELPVNDNINLYNHYGLVDSNNKLIIQTYQTDEDVSKLNEKLKNFNSSNPNYFLKTIKTSKGFVVKIFETSNNQSNYSDLDTKNPISINEIINLAKDYFNRIGVDLSSIKNKMINEKISIDDLALLGRNLLLFSNNKDVNMDISTFELGLNLIQKMDPAIYKNFINVLNYPQFKNILNTYFNTLKKISTYKTKEGNVDIMKIKNKLLVDIFFNSYKNLKGESTTFNSDENFIDQDQLDNFNILYQGFQNSLLKNISKFEVFDQSVKDVLLDNSNDSVIQLRKDLMESNRFKTIRDAVDSIYNKILQENKNIILNSDENDRHYTYKGQRVLESVTQFIKKGKEIFSTEKQKLQNDNKKNWGLVGHKYIEDLIKANYIDADGYLLKEFKNDKVPSDLKDEVKSAIKDYITSLMNQYKRNDKLRNDGISTRIMIETKVVNTSHKGLLASTVDFLAIIPDDVYGFKIDTLDWKFVDVNKSTNSDIPFYKRKDWNSQMKEYIKMYKTNLYGIKNEQIGKARMIPIVANYKYVDYNKPEKGLVLNSIEIENLNDPESNTIYTMPVPISSELTENYKVDELIKQLEIEYNKLYENLFKDTEKQLEKNEILNQLAISIRSLHVNLDFTELIKSVGNFIEIIQNDLSNLENIDYQNLSNKELEEYHNSLLNFEKTISKFLNLDDVYLSTFSGMELNQEALDNLYKIRNQSLEIEDLLKKIKSIKNDYIVQLAVTNNIVKEEFKEDVLKTEREIGQMSKTFLETSQLTSSIVKLASNLVNKAKSLSSINTNEQIDNYYSILTEAEQQAKFLGKSVSDLILSKNSESLSLIKELSKEFWTSYKNATLLKSKEFLIENVNKKEFVKYLNEILDSKFAKIDLKTYNSTNNEYIDFRRLQEKQKLKQSLNLYDINFNGYDNKLFKIIFLKSLIKTNWESPEFKELKKHDKIYKVWEIYRKLNQKGKNLGYLSEKNTLSFFPLIEESYINKAIQNDNFIGETVDFFKSFYKINENESQKYSKLDPETNELKRKVPKFYTSNKSGVDSLSKDLRKVGALWIKALNEYETNKSLETTLMMCYDVEKAKGVFVTDEKGELVKSDKTLFKIDYSNQSNADIIKTLMDDQLYGIKENNNTFLDLQFKKIGKSIGAEDESIENVTVNTKKALNTLQNYMQGLAIGLKFTIAIPNYFGVNFQSFINGGKFYKFSEFTKNNIKVTINNGMSLEEKGILNKLTILNEDIASNKIREKAYKDSYLDWLQTWNFNDVMMITNAWPEKKLQLANALSFIENSTIVNGKIVNIREYLKNKNRKEYYDMSEKERKEFDNNFENLVDEYKKTKSLDKLVKFQNNKLNIPGVSDEEFAKFRLQIFEYSRKLNGQLSDTNKAQYRRDSIFKSFMTFKNWIPKQISNRILDIREDVELGTWEYGRVRLFLKTLSVLSYRNVSKIIDVIKGTDEGISIMKQMLEDKKREYFEKNGRELRITNEEFYDLVRTELSNEVKELKLLLSLMLLGTAVAFLKGDDDDDDDDDLFTKNKLKYLSKLIHKTTDEVSFYYNPLSFNSITSGSVFPALGVFYKVRSLTDAVFNMTYGYVTDDEDLIEKTHLAKSAMDMIPVLSQFQKEYLPIIDPELAKELGIKVSEQSRIMR